ncbi:response regulator [bacterium]|nr:response regulator [bacterium]
MHCVLAVDDEPANQRAVRRVLADDHEVLVASSAAEALEVLARAPVALVISDHRMPGMTGAAFLAETAARHPAVIRVVLTGYPEVELLLDAINRGHVYHFLTKPWQAHELCQVVRRGLDAWEAAAERGRLLDELRAACGRAEREAAQRARMLVLAAHELGTPVHLLLNALALLRERPLPPDTAPWFAIAERAADWLAAGAAQLHAGAIAGGARALVVRPQAVALRPLVDAAVAAIATASGRRLTLGASGAATAVADPHWVASALAALLTNAVRSTPDGGTVAVHLAAADDAVEIAVRDTGIGIAAEHLPHIFEPFSTAGGDLLLHSSGRWAFGARGLGIGLATVRAIAEAHGGRVAVESAVGQGSCFRLRLPAARG